ncbi:lipid transfer protein [Gamsiella multidivaricata]|uniref:lipid transfer protein n=1 Tax=Gamsiella multidivaricata TaxID=101098 RepID=UPI00221EEBA7|nr:lipid transfer protein [Gamsiella multidivaricata]KAI7816079.1 lipid transfer protein [Gamsiella multidivaricata]
MSLAVDGFKSSALLTQIDEHLKALSEAERQEQVKKVKGVFQFNVKNKEGKVATWTFDLKTGNGAMHKGTVNGLKPDITIDIADDDFIALAEGKANGQKLFMSGKIKVKGAIMMATKLDSVLNAAKEKSGFKAKL